MSLVEDLRSLDCGDVDATPQTLAAFSHDASIFEVMPTVVVAPRDASDIEKVVQYAAEHPGVALTPRAGGTDMSGAALGASVVLNFTKYMHQLHDIGRDKTHSEQDGFVVVQPGMYYRDLERATLARGLQYPVYPASRDICAVGGMVGNNAAGERSLQYGQTVDWVRSLRAVLADGKEYEFGPLDAQGVREKMALETFEGDVYRGMWNLVTKHQGTIERTRPQVTKNSSGYYLWRIWDGTTFDLSKVLIGSQGTLGVVTEATMGMMRPAPHRRMVVTFLDEVQRVTEVVNALLPFEPEALESFDDKTLSFTLRFLPDFVRVMGASNIISLGLRFLPEAWMVLVSGTPKLIVLAEFSGDDEAEVEERAAQALQAMGQLQLKARLTKSTEESHKYWTIRRQSFNVLRKRSKGKRTTPFIDDLIVPVEHMPEFLPKLYAMLRPYRLTLTIAGHVGNGNFHIIPLMDLSDERTREIIPEIAQQVYDLVLSFRGSITAEHNDGMIRGPWVRRQYGPKMYDLFRQTKEIFDPKGIFNPGRKINVDWDWALQHIRTD